MATVTPNFNWPVPTSTDLVKDGATAIEALGDSIDASLLDLKGGTSGQVLSKNSNTDMDFVWVAADDTNAIQNTIVDAKGDLITATAADTPDRLAVGTNGQVLTADSTAATGLKWAAGGASFNTGYNYVATGQSTSSSTYTDLTTVQSTTVTTGTKALVNIQATIETSTSTRRGQISFAVSGATTVAADAQKGSETTCTAAVNFYQTINYSQVITGLTAGSNVFTIKFASPTANSMYFRDRTISVVDLGS